MISQKDSIHNKIEHICQQGCSVVRQYIKALEIKTHSQETKDSDSKPTAELAPDLLPELLRDTTLSQQQDILEELKTIMAVYDNKNCDNS